MEIIKPEIIIKKALSPKKLKSKMVIRKLAQGLASKKEITVATEAPFL